MHDLIFCSTLYHLSDAGSPSTQLNITEQSYIMVHLDCTRRRQLDGVRDVALALEHYVNQWS